jgi:hypothetical protein
VKGIGEHWDTDPDEEMVLEILGKCLKVREGQKAG